ncbi:hypothetical protein [Kitasatospora sp. SUK 42]|uniref:hypothetical protein n=1 Tax=Kitasatospora sp. SUK 42 TaxID=1588882 RepID=UPI0018CB93CA|nr:hypothetical protein [Kitasatospora sp. SUK 42]MBV2151906.1 hypothetical protein [Kitasatospora sp. SUK 42]
MAKPSAGKQLRRFGGVDELADAAELLDVTFLEISGRRLFDRPEERREEDDRTSLLAWLREADDGTGLEVRCRLELGNTQANFAVDAVAAFTVGEPFELEPALQQEFIELIGVTILYPYLRESVHSTAVKLGVDTPMLSLRNPWAAARQVQHQGS